MEDRLSALHSLLKEDKYDAILLSSPSNIIYTTGFSGFSSHERDGYVLLTKKAGYILTNPLYAEAVKQAVPHLTLLTYSASTPLIEHLSHIAAQHRLTRVGFEAENLTVAEYDRFRKIVPALTPIELSSIRIQKSELEIAYIRKASYIADQALKKTIPHIAPGMTEEALVRLLEDAIRTSQSEIAFPTIVAFGKNAAIPHHKSDSTKLRRNDLILIDFGAVYRNYRSDMTRTFFIGSATTTQMQTYHAVLTAQQRAVAYIKEALTENKTITAKDVDSAARNSLITKGYPSIPHSLGHGIGLEVHEAPHLSPYGEIDLTNGMVFSIEPGVYFPGTFGIRIEDLYVIKDGRLKQLTHAPSTLRILP